MSRLILAIARWIVTALIALGRSRGRAEVQQEQAAAASQAAQEARRVQEDADAQVVAYRRDGARQRLREHRF